jgi:hypothetical protein
MENDIVYKQQAQGRWNGYINVRQESESDYQRKRRLFHDNKEAKSPEEIAILSEYAPNNWASKCLKQTPTELKRVKDISIITVGDFATLS